MDSSGCPIVTVNGNGRCRPAITAATDPGTPVTVSGSRGELRHLELRPVAGRKESRLWNKLIERYHYLGYQPLPGAQMRYFIADGQRLLGCIGLGAAAWRVAPPTASSGGVGRS